MSELHISLIAKELQIQETQVDAVAGLLAGGATVPFLARYRKEQTGSLDEVVITSIRDRLVQLKELDERRQAILLSLEERGLITPELKDSITGAGTLTALEDIYLPYRPKRRTRATIAREKGLEPLAALIFAQKEATDPAQATGAFLNPEKAVNTADEALAGARDIIAEWVSEEAKMRQYMRMLFNCEGILQSTVVKSKEAEGINYRDYYQFQEPVSHLPGHRILAMFRGETEEFLKLTIRPPEEKALALLSRYFIQAQNASSAQVLAAIEDGYKRLLAPAMETDVRQEIKVRADEEAVRVFAQNLRELLMAPPLGQKRVLAIDPGFKTGGKVVCLDEQGKLIYNTTIYPALSAKAAEEAKITLLALVNKFNIEAIAIGSGTAGRETENFVRNLGLPTPVMIVMVNESGASIYSASDAARQEFPDYDLTVRGSVSIGRRLMDPLAELVKIDPKSIGVGQYQHDVDHNLLKSRLDDVVISCVNGVGVEVNTASKQLLAYVSGLGASLGENIVAYRNENGPFKSRKELRKVARLGPKAFEQAAGFLRIRGAANPLDSSAIHPERYDLVTQMAKDLNCSVSDLMQREELRRQINLTRYVSETAGLPTLTDILAELGKPGRDPRDKFEVFAFAEGIHSPDDLQPGMVLPGIVTNVTQFGAFVDIGVHQDGLVHISKLSDHYVKNPSDIVKVAQKVIVTVIEIDRERHRISLSMLNKPQAAG
jgi:protein Tex